RTWQIHEGTGQRIVGANGRYAMTSTTNNNIGNINPDWIGGVFNSVKYKDLSLSFLIDVRKGGSVFSLDTYYGMAAGIYLELAGLLELGYDLRLSRSEGGRIIMPGVDAEGKPNPIGVNNDAATYKYGFKPQSDLVFQASHVKLREVTLTYS